MPKLFTSKDVTRALKLIGDCEASFKRRLTHGEAMDLLADNSKWDRIKRLAIVGACEANIGEDFPGGGMKVSEWLSQNTDSHDIYDDTRMRERFKVETGFDAPWKSHTREATAKAIESRGLGGQLTTDPDFICCYGYEMAAACAKKFADFYSAKMGRGFMYRDCIENLAAAGK